MMQYLGRVERSRSPDDPGADAVHELLDAGVGAIVLDAEPGQGLSAARLNRARAIIGRHFGAPIDLGCALVWWLDPDVPAPEGTADGPSWRERAVEWKTRNPAPDLPVLIQPMWDTVRSEERKEL